MRQNLPVTQREFDFPADATLMSSTDTSSHITYANEAFIQVSGFERDEILGSPHNMVRHPDMPREAFADMWETLKSGQSWTALVKNRRKDGDHYWVRANATPVVRGGSVVGYMSVRTKPCPLEVQEAETLYRDFREGRAGSRAFHRGLVVHKGLMAWRSVGQTLPITWRLALPLVVNAVLALATAHWLGLDGDGFGGLAALGGVLAVATLLAYWLLQAQIVQPLKQVLAQAQSVAAGQAGQNLHFDRVDEIGMLMRAVNQSGLNLKSLVDDVAQQVSGVRQASDTIASGNSDLSQRTDQAASQLQQTASSMAEMTATVRTNTETAQTATSLAGEASAAASRGGDVVGRVVGTMSEISASSRRIADIIGTIDGIAFQTNILALNAAVEAARAGEQGRGFAVVASEVRSLARRSADAAREIKQLIQASVQTVEAGSSLVDDAGRAMGDIVNKVSQVTQLIDHISQASAEQIQGIDQVNTAVSQLDDATRRNAGLVQDSTQSAARLQDQAERLAEAIGVFNSRTR
ncbi:methyl-accepting chemotaxis protein [Pseudaquabacterium pictum]|uniref:Methyl-accepting chemotaxis protein n=1 Tax=Pseudaquabacterium pictum TaxID=2315236 RepID=A0A480AID5_9BURK|nr:PAS domain-containing methyl-accepting chemotaxis protein [Rubrivivax pictus]GCL61193.1 methyl-accepting chemotaxis protein [Rubrivivax pictus]